MLRIDLNQGLMMLIRILFLLFFEWFIYAPQLSPRTKLDGILDRMEVKNAERAKMRFLEAFQKSEEFWLSKMPNKERRELDALRKECRAALQSLENMRKSAIPIEDRFNDYQKWRKNFESIIKIKILYETHLLQYQKYYQELGQKYQHPCCCHRSRM